MTGGNNCKIFRLQDKQEANRYIADHSGTYYIARKAVCLNVVNKFFQYFINTFHKYD